MKKDRLRKKIVKARIIKGAGRGRKIKVPTINFDPASARGLKEGIYVCRVIFPSTSSGQVSLTYWGVLHFGPRPAFNEANNSFEAHLFEFKEEVEIRTADIEIYDFIRKIINFESAEAMVEEINNDIKFAMKKINYYSSK